MSKARLVITAVVVEGRGVREVARDYGVSPGWVSRLVARYRDEGDAAFEPRSRRPHESPLATPAETIELIVELRRSLAAGGDDAGAETIRWHLKHHYGVSRSAATIGRYLHRAGLITAQPHKRPARRMCGSRPSSRMRPGRRTSPTIGSLPASTSKCCVGWMITPATRCA